MDCEELKNPVAKAFDNARKVMRTEDGIESEMESSESITLPPSVVSYPPWFHWHCACNQCSTLIKRFRRPQLELYGWRKHRGTNGYGWIPIPFLVFRREEQHRLRLCRQNLCIKDEYKRLTCLSADPLLPVVENLFSPEDLIDLLQSPVHYMQTFRDAIFGEDPPPIDFEERVITIRITENVPNIIIT